MIDELIKYDKEFNESSFISKVNNIYIMILSSLMNNNIDKVRHFLGDELEKKYDELINNLKNNNQRVIFEMPNIKSTKIVDIQINEDKYVIKVELVSKYIKYYINTNNGKSSNHSDDRTEVINYLTLEKKRNTTNQGIAKFCPACGHNISVNTSGKCEFCGNIYNQELFDWVLVQLDI